MQVVAARISEVRQNTEEGRSWKQSTLKPSPRWRLAVRWYKTEGSGLQVRRSQRRKQPRVLDGSLGETFLLGKLRPIFRMPLEFLAL